MPQSQDADSFVDSLKNTFVKPVANVLNTVDKYIPDSLTKPKPDTSWHDSMVKQANDSAVKQQSVKPQPAKPPVNSPVKPTKPVVPKYNTGTDYVPKTGKAVLHKGEAVLKKEDADKYREAKGMSKTSAMKSVAEELGGKSEKPKKEIKHSVTKKAKNGGYIHEHHHTAPEHHPMEEHVSPDQDAMVDHMMQHMGEANPGEAEADAGQSGIPAAGATPAPAAGATPAPAAQPIAPAAV